MEVLQHYCDQHHTFGAFSVTNNLGIDKGLHWSVPMVIAIPVLVTLVKIFVDTQITPFSLQCHSLVRQFEELDAQQSLQPRGVLVLGGEHLTAWDQPPSKIGDQPLLVRAKPGLTPALAAECFERLVGFYQPATLVLFLPTAAINQNVSTLIKVLTDIRELANYYNVAPQIAIVPPIQTPRDGQAYASFTRFIGELTSRTKTTPGIAIWPLSDALMSTRGQVDATLFWPDGKTLYPDGYERLASRLEQQARGGPL